MVTRTVETNKKRRVWLQINYINNSPDLYRTRTLPEQYNYNEHESKTFYTAVWARLPVL